MKTSMMIAVQAISAGTAAREQLTLSAEGSNPGSSHLTTIMTLGEFASAAGLANFQVQDGQTLTDSLLNVARGTTDIAPVPLIAPFMLAHGAGPYASMGPKRARSWWTTSGCCSPWALAR